MTAALQANSIQNQEVQRITVLAQGRGNGTEIEWEDKTRWQDMAQSENIAFRFVLIFHRPAKCRFDNYIIKALAPMIGIGRQHGIHGEGRTGGVSGEYCREDQSVSKRSPHPKCA